MATTEELRLMARVARMYFGEALRQPEIAARLGISQARVSRLLKRAEAERIVRITVVPPPGVFPRLEAELQSRYDLKLAVVVDALSDAEADVLPSIGAAAAYHLETTLGSHDRVGIVAWSRTILATVDAMSPVPGLEDVQVIQVLGGLGDPAAPAHASWLTRRLADLVGGQAVYLPSPGIAGSVESARALREDRFVRDTLSRFDDLTLALIPFGRPRSSGLLAGSGNVFSAEEMAELETVGAVGDLCLRYFDADGRQVESPLMERVIGIDLAQLARVPRSIGVGGGTSRLPVIAAALRGHLVNTLITDRFTAERLLRDD